MRITVNFSLKKSKSRTDDKCPIYLRCTMHGQRFELSTGIFIDPVIWNEEKQQVKGRSEDVKILNSRLDKTASRVQDIYNRLESKGERFSVIQVKNKLRGVSGEKGVLEILDGIINGIVNIPVNSGSSSNLVKLLSGI